MRILFVAWRDLAHPKAGGSEVVVDFLARGLQERGHDVTVMCGGPTAPRPYPVVPNGGTFSQYLTAPVRYGRRFRDVDIVVDVVNGMPFFSPLWRRAPRLALVTHVHTDQWGSYFPRPIAAVARTVEGRGLPFAYRNTRFVTISPSTATELEHLGVDRDRIQVMWLGAQLDEPVSEVERSPEPMFLALGRLAPNKRLDTLLDLWARVAPTTGGRLVIVGDGPERDRLAERIRTEPALSGVVLEGRVTEARKSELLRQAWLLVHTAVREGWGLVIPEAGLCRTPALAYDVPGVRDAVHDGVTGMLAADDDAFVANWIALAQDPALRSQLGAHAAELAATYTWDRSVDEFLVAAEAAIADKGATRPRPASAGGLQVSVGLTAGATGLLSVTTRGAQPGAGGEPPLHHPLAAGPSTGIARSVHLLKLFRKEAVDPDRFYHYLAGDVLRHISRYQDPAGALALDIGGGPGYTAEALKAAGADCVVADYSLAELGLHNRQPDNAVQCDGQALPFNDASLRIVYSSNVLEHVPVWQSMLSEMVRVLEPDTGLGYLTFTNWYSPWGGHETSPWHYFGGRRAVERYERRYGKPPKNEFGVSLYRLNIREVLDWFHARNDLDLLWVGPRYMPEWMRWIERVPGVREVVTWNLVVIFRRRVTQ